MSSYVSGNSVQHTFTVYDGGVAVADGGLTSISAKLYIDGTYSAPTVPTVANIEAGLWKVTYTCPSAAEGADLDLTVQFTHNGDVYRLVWSDQFLTIPTPSSVQGYLMSYPISVNLTTSQKNQLVTEIETGGVTATEIADNVLRRSVGTAMAGGTIGRHSLGSLVLIATNADTTSHVGYITTRHPDTDALVYEYQVTTGAGCPIQSVT